MRRYVETFFRHKLLLCLPVVLALFISIWYVTTETASYYASTTLWFDTEAPAASSLDTSAQFTTPAALAQSVLQELATTREFLTDVGNNGPLAKYLATHHATKHGPSAELSQLLHKLKGSSTAAPAPIDDQILATLTGSISSAVIGPQVLRVNLKGPDPTVTVGTLNEVTAELTTQVTGERQSRDIATVNYYKSRLDAASKALTAAKTDETTYLQSHPATAYHPETDPTLNQLIAAVSAADAQYTSIQNSYSDANLAATDSTESSSFHVIDPAYPLGGKSSKKKEMVSVAAGLFMGLFISLLVLTGLTAADNMARRGEDFENTEGLEVVATIQQLPAIRALNRGATSA